MEGVRPRCRLFANGVFVSFQRQRGGLCFAARWNAVPAEPDGYGQSLGDLPLRPCRRQNAQRVPGGVASRQAGGIGQKRVLAGLTARQQPRVGRRRGRPTLERRG